MVAIMNAVISALGSGSREDREGEGEGGGERESESERETTGYEPLEIDASGHLVRIFDPKP